MEELSFKKRVQVCFKANDVRCVAGKDYYWPTSCSTS